MKRDSAGNCHSPSINSLSSIVLALLVQRERQLRTSLDLDERRAAALDRGQEFLFKVNKRVGRARRRAEGSREAHKVRAENVDADLRNLALDHRRLDLAVA